MKTRGSNMADEDEIDILGGEFDLETLFTKEDERLICYDGMDVPSQWLLDTTAQPCWYAENKPMPSDDLVVPMSSTWGDADTWTSNEKDLLDRGLSLFGRSWPRLAQYVGTKNVHQVKNYLNLQSASSFSEVGALGFAEIIDDFQIPASMEEVIAVVSTAQPTVSEAKNKVRLKGKRGRPPTRPRPEQGVASRGRRNPRGRPPKLARPSKPSAVGGEEVVRIDNQESDVDVDVESDTELEQVSPGSERTEGAGPDPCRNVIREEEVAMDVVESAEETCQTEPTNHSAEPDVPPQRLTEQQLRMKTHQLILDKIYDMPPPRHEVTLDPFVITDGEREVHTEFFQGRQMKTPSRYLKIRNHIVGCWASGRPGYVSKTSVRAGLKNCGDVNCIGRIHAYLEQAGAINFGCEQARYDRPLPAPSPYDLCPPPCPASPRKARKLPAPQHGGYTITHREDGTTQTHVVVEPGRPRGGNAAGGAHIQLICCKKFDDEHKASYAVQLDVGALIVMDVHAHASHCEASYAVQLDVGALIVMDVHAHASHCEVIGLLGGSFYDSKLTVTRTVPCKAASSQVHCDMCPVSQTQASEQLMSEGLDVIGWYHSHPTFSPNPSLQDIVTQRSMQALFRDRPFLGIILSPHTIASTYRCIVVVGEGEGEGTPYRHNVRLVARGMDTAALRRHLGAVFRTLREQETPARFQEVVNAQLPITYLEKCVESVSYHLGRCGSQLSQPDKDHVAQIIRQLATSKLTS